MTGLVKSLEGLKIALEKENKVSLRRIELLKSWGRTMRITRRS